MEVLRGFTGKNNLRPPEITEEQREASSHWNVYRTLPLGKCQSWILMVVSSQKQRGRSYLVTQITKGLTPQTGSSIFSWLQTEIF